MFVLPTTVSTIAPWLLKCPVVNLSLCCYDRTTTSPELIKHKFFELWLEFSNHFEIYTDGSKDGLRTAAPNNTLSVNVLVGKAQKKSLKEYKEYKAVAWDSSMDIGER